MGIGEQTATTTAVTGGSGAEAATVPAPWALRLRGVVLFLRDTGAPPRSGLSAFRTVAWVDYAQSNVGPYRELLFTGPVQRRPQGTGPSVQDIWVTSQASAISGNANWGLTKSVAAIDRVQSGGGREEWNAADDQGDLGTLVHRPVGPSLPVGKPRGLGRLLQARDGHAYATPVSVGGLVRFTRIESLTLNASRLLDLERFEVAAAISCTHTRMGFHAATVTPLA